MDLRHHFRISLQMNLDSFLLVKFQLLTDLINTDYKRQLIIYGLFTFLILISMDLKHHFRISLQKNHYYFLLF